MEFLKLSKLKDVRTSIARKGSYTNVGVSAKTDIAIHHSLTKQGSASAFANYHVHTLGWQGIGYHFVITKDGTIEWCHDLGIRSYHVGDSNTFALGICLVGDFRSEKPTKAQEDSLYALHEALKKDLPNYQRTRGHNEFPGYAWKACPVFDYKAVIFRKPNVENPVQSGLKTYTVKRGDTLYSIAKALKVSVDALQNANKGVKANSLQIGAKLNVPGSTSVQRYHTVKRGETLSHIAVQYNVTVKALQDANPSIKPTAMQIGERVAIPNGSTSVAPKPKPVAKKKYMQLPKSESSWRVYPLNQATTVGNETGFLNPAKFGGLEYEVLKELGNDTYEIQTSNFGRVKIYAPTSFGVKFVTK